MKLFATAIAATGLLIVSCAKSSDSSGGSPTVPQKPEGTHWVITARSCDGQPQELLGTETVQFGDTFLVYSYGSMETNEKRCKFARVFNHLVTAFNQDGQKYTETAQLDATQGITRCWDKVTGAQLPDQISAAKGSPLTLTLTLTATNGSADVQGWSSCRNGTAHFELQRQ